MKAVAGGGGKGMRVARSDEELVQGFMSAQAEGQAAFGNPDLFMEKYIESARHVEVQIIGDKHGNVCHVGNAIVRSSGGIKSWWRRHRDRR